MLCWPTVPRLRFSHAASKSPRLPPLLHASSLPSPCTPAALPVVCCQCFLVSVPHASSHSYLTLAAFPCLADISELDLPKSVSISFPEGNDKIMNFEVTLKPDEGLYK